MHVSREEQRNVTSFRVEMFHHPSSLLLFLSQIDLLMPLCCRFAFFAFNVPFFVFCVKPSEYKLCVRIKTEGRIENGTTKKKTEHKNHPQLNTFTNSISNILLRTAKNNLSYFYLESMVGRISELCFHLVWCLLSVAAACKLI